MARLGSYLFLATLSFISFSVFSFLNNQQVELGTFVEGREVAEYRWSLLPMSLPNRYQTIYPNAEIFAENGSVKISLKNGGTLSLKPQARASFNRDEDGRINIRARGSFEINTGSETTAKISLKLPNQQPIFLDRPDTQVTFDVDPSQNLATTKVFQGEITFSPNIIKAGQQMALKLDTSTVVPNISAIDFRLQERFFADIRNGQPNVTVLDRLKLHLPEPYDVINTSTSGIQKRIDFQWDQVPGVSQYHFQISSDLRFDDIVFEDYLRTNKAQVSPPRQGTYFWRVRPLATDYQFSRFSKPRRFIVK